MKTRTAVMALFWLAAAYDGVLGLAFLTAHNAIFQWFDVTPPNHPGYIEFPGALLVVFGILFVAVARNPEANRNLIPYGILLKVAYCGVAFWHWFQEGIPNMWKPYAIADLGFLALFYAAYRQLGKEPSKWARVG